MSFSKLGKTSAVLLLSSAILVACGGGEERQAEYLERAQSYYDAENYDKAKIEVKNVLQINPNNADARYLSGLIAESDKDLRAAFGNYNAAYQADKTHIKAINKLASFYVMSRDLDSATEKVNEALAVDPQNADALNMMAVIYASQEKQEEAILKAQEAISIDPGHVQANGLLAALYAKDNPDLAMEVITKGIANQSKNESLKVLKLRLLMSQGKRDEAVAMFKELIAEYPDKLFYNMQLINFYLQDASMSEEDRKDLAEKTLKELVAAKPDQEQPKLWLAEFTIKNRSKTEGIALVKAYLDADPSLEKMRNLLAELYISEQDFDAAKSLYQKVVQEDPESVRAIDARNKLATIAITRGERDAASNLLEEIFKLDAENSDALLTRAKIKMVDKKGDEAIADLRIVLKNDPESAEALGLLARAYETTGAVDLALDSYQRLLAIQPNNMVGMLGAAKLLVAKNENAEALTIMEKAAKIDAANPEVGQMLSDLYSREQRWDDALSASAKLIENERSKALGHYLQGRIYLRSKNYDSALKSLQESLQLEPSGVETLSAIAAAYSALNQDDKAVAFVKEHLAKYPDHAHAKELLATLYARSGETGKAIELCQALIKAQPDRISAYTLLGRLYGSKGEVDKLESMYLEAIRKNPETSLLRVSLAEVYQASNKSDMAIEQYEEGLKISPNALVIKNNLASLLLDRDDNPATIQRAAELSSELAATDNPAFLDTAGWAQYKLGNYAQAVSLLGAAVEGGGKAPVFHYHLGMAYFKSDLPAQAKEQLSLALEGDASNFVGREEAEKTLQSL